MIEKFRTLALPQGDAALPRDRSFCACGWIAGRSRAQKSEGRHLLSCRGVQDEQEAQVLWEADGVGGCGQPEEPNQYHEAKVHSRTSSWSPLNSAFGFVREGFFIISCRI